MTTETAENIEMGGLEERAEQLGMTLEELVVTACERNYGREIEAFITEALYRHEKGLDPHRWLAMQIDFIVEEKQRSQEK